MRIEGEHLALFRSATLLLEGDVERINAFNVNEFGSG
jgi:hypothetical protein